MQWQLEAGTEIEQDAKERMVEQAWHTVRIWVRSHRKDGGLQVPQLKTLLQEVKRKRGKPQSFAAMRESLQMLSGQYGIPVRTVDAAKG